MNRQKYSTVYFAVNGSKPMTLSTAIEKYGFNEEDLLNITEGDSEKFSVPGFGYIMVERVKN